MTEERRSGVYARRRDLREAPLRPPPPETLAAWVRSVPEQLPTSGAGPGSRGPTHESASCGPTHESASRGPTHESASRGPTTQDLELYRPDPALPARPGSLDAVALRAGAPGHPHPSDRGERARAFVERWSVWAAGLGKPPRDRSGRRRYPGREGLLPPALLLAAGLGLAGLIGLLTGLLLRSPGGDAAAASATPPTVTVTQQVTLPAVTETRTRTRTRTVTTTAAPQNPNAATVLQPGAQGPAVLQLQQDLATLGLFQGQPNGSYDEETRAGVQAFQGGFGVAGDPPGVAGPATLTAIAKAVGRA